MLVSGLGWDEHGHRHVLPGRLLLSIKELRRNPEVCSRIVQHLQRCPEIDDVTARPLTGRVLVRFNPNELSVDDVEARILSVMNRADVAATLDTDDKGSVVSENYVQPEIRDEATKQRMWENWHCLPLQDVARRVETSLAHGLDEYEAHRRRDFYGPNRLDTGEPPNIMRVIVTKLRNPITLLLIGTGGVSLVASLWLEALAAFSIASMTTYLGVKQEVQASRALDSLEQLSAPHAVVKRGGDRLTVDARDVVIGDVITLEEGDRVPADARVIFSAGLKVDESALTGESCPVVKDPNAPCHRDTPLANRGNMIFSGTVVVGGRARAVVVATGMDTQVGRLAAYLREDRREVTPLQRRLQRLAKVIFWVILGVGFVGTVAAITQGIPFGSALAQAVGVAVTAMPHGLPMTVTIALSVAVSRLARRGAMARKLGAMESLGATTTICSDKTGTLTRNQLVVREIVTHATKWKVTGEGYIPSGQFLREGEPAGPDDCVTKLLGTAALCSNARVVKKKGQWSVDGDATEGALLVAGIKAGLNLKQLRTNNRRLSEVPFSAESRSMTVVCATDDGVTTIVKGAPEAVLSMCHAFSGTEGPVNLTPLTRQRWLAEAERLAGDGQRVLAIARGIQNGTNRPINEGFEFLGLVGMMDAPRVGVKSAVLRCRRAGIRVMMLTGDHPVTAEVIAREVGILDDDGLVLTGSQIEAESDEQLRSKLERLAVGARLTPEHKVRIVRLLKENGEVVAMTGDGVNDAPALHVADVGIAMGLAGTDVTKGAANLVLTNDDFCSIVDAVESGRAAYDNIRRSLTYSLSTNGGEALMALVPLLFGLPLPVPVAALLLSNMLCDGPVSLSLATDSSERGLMTSKSRKAGDGIFDRMETKSIATRAVKFGLTTLGLYAVGIGLTGSPGVASSMALSGLVGTKLVFAHRLRRLSADESARIKRPQPPNLLLMSATAAGIGFTAFGMYVPVAARLLRLAPLGPGPLAIVAASVWAQGGFLERLFPRLRLEVPGKGQPGAVQPGFARTRMMNGVPVS